ncbi:dTDP-4-dehydrorhamnose 3,5-epimerase [Rhizobium azibense]|nr:dTDP-4-dehydrorhamnose 3,5-epimerase [Rhizobium azibense]
MKFHGTPLDGAYVIEPEPRGDERGWFQRVFCEREMADAGMEGRFVQVNNSFNAEAGTLRGLHYQLPPSPEVKIIRCISGALWDCIVDLRPDSATYRGWHAVELTGENRLAFYVPRGFAHGFVTLRPNTETLYLASEFYDPKSERGVRWNDPKFGITWPVEGIVISEKDAKWPDFDEDFHGVESLRGI